MREMRPSTMLVLAVLLAMIFVPMFFIDMSALKKQADEQNLQNVPRIDLPVNNAPREMPREELPPPPANRPRPPEGNVPVVE